MSTEPIPDDVEDAPVAGSPVTSIKGPLALPALIFGAGSLSNQYNTDEHLESYVPLRAIRLALRYGIHAFDTSIYYGPSEIVLGKALQAIKDEFPRSSYKLMTKCGRINATDFDYTPGHIRNSVQRSLERLQTHYLDTVYLHDTEFVCTPVMPTETGYHATALEEAREAYGLAEGQESTVRGEGDQKILDAFAELSKMKEEGLIKHIGITGYPLPVLLRLALLILHNPPYKPVDVVLSYSHLTLQDSTFLKFVPHLRERAKVEQLVVASPFSMGLLTSRPPPPWHPSPEAMRKVTADAREAVGDLPDLALRYSMRKCGAEFPLVVGFSNPQEVHASARVWRQAREEADDSDRLEREERAREIFQQAGYLDWSWASP
ncbi:Aldo/keto reductase [Desarmillaria tabescens]|uniref:Aldo/keto reductase n=1 Tax=Armillaria tabescens TaxID=1929756 RepID=A0AA39NLL4_ARMTA|nr:Aldo/keto reductase [Desarmillaria tabescens]KAK0467897.1 Aldo/keto reductase [Desarmillaria tabescens]